MTDLLANPNTVQARPLQARRALYSPLIDFLLLGGASIFVLPLTALLNLSYSQELVFAAFITSFFVNFAHFANSYQIFYRDFGNKLRGIGYAPHMRLRYAIAGLLVPVLIALLQLGGYAMGDQRVIGLSASAMAFFVGWHYVKQGYGILIVDAVMNRAYFNDAEKKTFRINAYACWIFFFVLIYHIVHEREIFGVKFFTVSTPLLLVIITGAVAAVTTALSLRSAYTARLRNAEKPLPFNGYVAYVSSLYVWLGIPLAPAAMLLVPALHSLQYLAVVWRYEFNRQVAAIEVEKPKPKPHFIWIRLLTFALLGIVIGSVAMWVMPVILDRNINYEKAIYGSNLFLFTFSVFINIHHYFLDNVMWRKDNPDVGKHLFGAR